MAYRKFDTDTWDRPWFEALSKDAKLLFIYLWTNNTCNPAGMYRISKDRIQFNCGVNIEKHLEELKDKVLWDNRESVVWVKSFFRRQRQNNRFSEAAVSSISSLPCRLKRLFYEHNQEILEADQIPPLPPITDTDTDTEADISSTGVEPDTNNGSRVKKQNGSKKLFLDAILLTEEEHGRLVDKYGEQLTTAAINILNQYVMSKGKKYKSHYHTIIGWPMEKAREGALKHGSYQRLDKFGKPAPRQKWEDEADRINAEYYRRKAADNASDGKAGNDPG